MAGSNYTRNLSELAAAAKVQNDYDGGHCIVATEKLWR